MKEEDMCGTQHRLRMMKIKIIFFILAMSSAIFIIWRSAFA
ncbi:hypothetical protein LCGC14_1092160 [marine sediment metagenome]|uniref:Uncharacterized protein n=1 Tax=marine sediment metagenome TaxID=412755 RepID=A0A0F9QI08_9ZZZZ